MTVRLTIRVPNDVAEKARAGVRAGHARSVSQYVAMAVGEMEHPVIRAFLDRYRSNVNCLSPEMQAWADAELAGLDVSEARVLEQRLP